MSTSVFEIAFLVLKLYTYLKFHIRSPSYIARPAWSGFTHSLTFALVAIRLLADSRNVCINSKNN